MENKRLQRNLKRRLASLQQRFPYPSPRLCSFAAKRASISFELPYLLEESQPTNRRLLGVVVYLHGSSGRSNVSSVLEWGLNKMNHAQKGNLDRFLIISPVCPRKLGGKWAGKRIEWTTEPVCEAVMDLLDNVLSTYKTVLDPSRVYLTGPSMGGLGTWMVGARNPERFAALVPICGGGKPLFAPLLRDKPIWFFHAANDLCVDVSESDRLVEALKKAGNTQVRFTRPKESMRPCCMAEFVGHNCWDDAYRDTQLWDWLWSHQLPAVVCV
jgi:predicted peptidase